MNRLVIDRGAFLAGLSDRPKEDVPIPELQAGAVIPVWGMTARERTAFEKTFAGKNGQTIDARVQEFRERLVVACCKDDNGQAIFLPEDVQAIGQKRADVLERIVNVEQRLSGFTREDIEATVGN